MFNSLRKLFGRRVETTVDATNGPRKPGTLLTVTPGFTPRATRVETPPPIATGAGATLKVPLKSILSRLPTGLMQRVRQSEVGDAEVSISMQKVLTQIAQGAVKLSFGELRQSSPPGTFTVEGDLDRSLVDLPLNEVIARINLSLLPRRQSQRHVEVPPEVTGPFGGQCRVAISTAPLKPVAPVQPPVRSQTLPPRTHPPAAPGQPPQRNTQPVVARVRTAPPASPVEPAPSDTASPELDKPIFTPVFNRNGSNGAKSSNGSNGTHSPVAPSTPPTPPMFTPIAPAPAPLPPSQPAAIPMPEALRSPAPIIPVAPVVPAGPVAPVEPVFAAPVIPIAPAEPVAAAPMTPIAAAPAAQSEPAPIPFTPPPAPPKPQFSTAGETRFLTVSIAELAASWPDTIKDELVAIRASGSSIALPFGLLETAMKSGKIAFPWKYLRTWIKPVLPATTSAHDGAVLELPLKLIAPLFLSELKSGKPQGRISVDDNIPDLFFDGAGPAETQAHAPVAPAAHHPAPAAPAPMPARVAPPIPVGLPTSSAAAPTPTPLARVAPPAPAAPVAFTAPAAPARSEDTNYFNRADTVEEQEKPVFIKKDGTPGTAFLKRYATPNDIVGKAAKLGGVDGALIALPDGLLVACKLPATMNADTVAAFLPQIFTKVSQCTRELRLGELNNLNFTVGNIPWKIFKVGAIYFAAFGRPGEAMPTAQLAGLAAELDHQK